ncbi:glycosyltransferase family 39 protein [candidate division KSB1 bacterium]|nr:glycosyltransferase family 39 protein [candidate division KSB1 bacterium]
MINKYSKFWLYLPVIVIAVFAHFWRLDAVSLWRDEATTACWAREILNSPECLPRVWNGEVLIAQGADAHDFDENFFPAMQSWLQFYVAALAFKLFGVSTFSARLLFSLCGLLGVYFMYRIGRLVFDSINMGLLAAFLTSVSFPYLLFVRECRYYALSMLFGILLIYEIVRFIMDREIRNTVSFYVRIAAWGALFYLANYLTFAILWGCLAVFFLFDWDKKVILKFILTSIILGAVLSIEFIWLHLDFVLGTKASEGPQLEQVWKYLKRNFELLNQIFPFYALIPSGIVLYFFGWRRKPLLFRAVVFIAAALFLSVIFNIILTKNQTQTRYYPHVIPLAILLFICFFDQIRQRFGLIAGVICLMPMMGWHNLLYFDNLNEAVVQQQFEGRDWYNAAIIEFIDKKIKPDETVAFYRNVKGMAMYFRFPWLKWVAQLDAADPAAQKYRNRLPDRIFDDPPTADWYILWDKRKFDMNRLQNYEKVWEYQYIRREERKRFWKKRKPKRFQYEVYRKIHETSGSAM